MSYTTKGDEAVYPVPKEEYGALFKGITKRELFAAMALQGLLAGSVNIHAHGENIADAIYLADALIAELERAKDGR